jgi:hypothetical protein
MTTNFQSPDDLNRFIGETRRELEANGFASAAARLADVQGGAFTTGSEWLGELGLAVKEALATKGLPYFIRERLNAIRGAVRAVWPKL